MECIICTEKIKIPVKLHCGHVFDYDCIVYWAYQCLPNNITCPIDRSIIKCCDLKPVNVSGNELSVNIQWMNGHKKKFYIDSGCSIQRLKLFLSAGIFKWRNLFDGMALTKKDGHNLSHPYGVTLLCKRRRLFETELIKDIGNDNDIHLHGYENLTLLCDCCEIDVENRKICRDEKCTIGRHNHDWNKTRNISQLNEIIDATEGLSNLLDDLD
jgi:hypothetical protein